MSEARPEVTVLDGLLFLDELWLVVMVVIVGERCTDATWGRVVLGIVLGATIVTGWSRLLAPRSPSRLNRAPRLVLKELLVVGAAAGLVAVGLPWWGLAFAVVSVPLQFAER